MTDHQQIPGLTPQASISAPDTPGMLDLGHSPRNLLHGAPVPGPSKGPVPEYEVVDADDIKDC